MNERYTYGYNNGWNVENEYINSLNELMNNYDDQIAKLEDIKKVIEDSKKQIEVNNNKRDLEISDEQIRAWYNEDHLLGGGLLSFEAYKRDILVQLEKTNSNNRKRLNEENQQLETEIITRQNEYVANLYYLTTLKDETRRLIFKRRNELELLLSEKNIQLSSILLEQQKNLPQTDEYGNIVNKNKLDELREKYDETWLEIRKVEHALQKLDEMFAMVEFTKEETDLMMRGLNPQQKVIYEEIIKPQPVPNPIPEPTPTPDPTPEPSPDEEVSSKVSQYVSLLEEYNKILEIYNEDLDYLYELQQKYENNEIDYSEYEKFADYMVERYRYVISLYEKILSLKEEIENLGLSTMDELNKLQSDLKNEYQFRAHQQNGLEINDDSYLSDFLEKIKNVEVQIEQRKKILDPINPEQPMMILEDKKVKPDPVPPVPPVPPVEEQDEKLTLEGIIEKVCGDKSFNDSQSSRYAASKIKVFSKPQKNKLGLAYKIVSIPRTVIGIIPKAAMKLYGMFITKKTKNIFKEMEARANNLTDSEVEVLLSEYKGARAQSFRLPKGFNNAVRPRIDKYVGTRIAKINEQILKDLRTINYCEKVINCLNNKLEEQNSPEMVERIHEVLEKVYARAYPSVKSVISLQVEGNKLQNGNGLHSFDEEVKALNTKMNYIGGRFSKAREYDPTLWSKVSSYSHVIENSSDPKEVVDSFIEREKIYKENTKERRSIFNLGSKVTVGKLDYRPFVETLNYGNDPFIRDLITSVLVVSSTASLINNIKNSVEASARQQDFINQTNAKIDQANRVGAEQQQFIENVRGSGDSIEKGMVYDIKQTEGSMENIADRGTDIQYNWNLTGSSYKAADAAHHLETSNLSVQNTEALLDLSSKYSSGVITHAEYLRGIHELKEHTTEVYERYISELSSTFENYAANRPDLDYTAVLSALRHASANPGDSVELSEVITNLYEQSLNVTNFESLNAIEATLSTPNLVPDLITLGAVTTKVTQEQVDSKKEIKPDAKKDKEIREMIEGLKAMKAELSEEEVKEIENLLR